MNVGLHVDVPRDVRDRLQRLADGTKGQLLEDSLVEGLGVIRDEWQSLFRDPSAPSIAGARPRYQTRTYLGSIQVVPGKSGGGHAEALVGVVGLEPEYDVFLEYGTSRMPPHPIARMAFMIAKGRARRQAVDSLRQAVKALMRK